MHAWEAIQKSVDYIEEHLEQEIATEELAKTAALSPFYFQRLFSRLVKRPVKEYCRLRRLAKSCELLAVGESRILDVAVACGFGSHQVFTRAFKEAYGMTPESYREHPVHLNQFDKPDLMLGYTVVDEGVPLLCEGLVLEMNRRVLREPIIFLGISGHVPFQGQLPLGEETGVDIPGLIWEKFHREKHRLPLLPQGRNLGVAYVGDAPSEGFTYFAGTEAAPGTRIESFDRWELPPREYLVCGFEAESFEEMVTTALNKAVKYTQLWLERKGLVSEAYSPELYYSTGSEGTYMELWIPASPKQGE